MFDAQPSCWTYIEAAIKHSALGDRAELVRGGVSTQDQDTQIDLERGTARGYDGWQSECDGHFGQRGRAGVVASTHTPSRPPAATRSWAPAYALGSFRAGWLGAALSERREIAFVKCDVEGAELGILNASLMPLLRQRRIRHLVMEATPGFWNASFGGSGSLAFAAQLMHSVAASGYSLETRTLKKSLACRSAVAAGQNVSKECWLWSPKQVRDYVRSMRGAEDLHFERTTSSTAAPLTSTPPRGASEADRCEAHSFHLAKRSAVRPVGYGWYG